MHLTQSNPCPPGLRHGRPSLEYQNGFLHEEVRNLLERGAIEVVPLAQNESDFYSHFFLIPKKDGGPTAHPQSQTSESRPHEMAIHDDYTETDPLTNSPRGLVLFSESE